MLDIYYTERTRWKSPSRKPRRLLAHGVNLAKIEQQRRPRLCPQRAGAAKAARFKPLPCGVVPPERENKVARILTKLNVGADHDHCPVN